MSPLVCWGGGGDCGTASAVAQIHVDPLDYLLDRSIDRSDAEDAHTTWLKDGCLFGDVTAWTLFRSSSRKSDVVAINRVTSGEAAGSRLRDVTVNARRQNPEPPPVSTSHGGLRGVLRSHFRLARAPGGCVALAARGRVGLAIEVLQVSGLALET